MRLAIKCINTRHFLGERLANRNLVIFLVMWNLVNPAYAEYCNDTADTGSISCVKNTSDSLLG